MEEDERRAMPERYQGPLMDAFRQLNFIKIAK